MAMLKEYETNYSQNKLQQLQWKEEVKEEYLVKDGQTKLKMI